MYRGIIYQPGSLFYQCWQFLLSQILFSFFVLFAVVSPASADISPSISIKIGVLAKRGHEHTLKRWEPTAAYLTRAIPDRRFEIIPLDFEAVRLAAMSQSIDFLITNSGYFVSLLPDYGLSRIATLANLHGDIPQHVFGGVIFTRADQANINNLQDLTGKSFWAVDRNSLGGWLAAWREFSFQEINPERDFGFLKFAGTHDAVVMAVQSGQADAGTVRTDTLERMAAEGKISLTDFKVLNSQGRDNNFTYLLSTRLYPEWPFVSLPQTSPTLAKKVAVALLNMSASSHAAQSANIGGWTVPLDYRPIQDLLKELHLSLYEQHIGPISFVDFLCQHWLTVLLLAVLLCLLVLTTAYTVFLNRKLEQRVDERTRELFQETVEHKSTEERLHRAEKMEAIGLMASGVAHDLNNILSGMISYPELLLMRLPIDSKLRQPITSIKESGLRAAEVVADLLTVARDAAKVRTLVNINTLVLEYLQSPEAEKIRSLYPELKISTQLADSLDLVCCSPSHVNKCIMNLVLNAAEAIEASGQIVICTENHESSAKEANAIEVKIGSYVTLTVSDNGSGIAPADLQHIFEPFYTKKKMGRSGTGIGLAVVWNSMEDHGGTVTVKSDDGGTSFTLFFPRNDEDCGLLVGKAEPQLTDIDLELRGNGERILVVDDEARQCDIAMQILTELGYLVQVVSSGGEAVDYVRKEPVDLLLLDMVMDPGMDGLQTFTEIIGFKPEQKALIVSGFSEKDKIERALSQGVKCFLKKPYTLRQLAVVVQKSLKD